VSNYQEMLEILLSSKRDYVFRPRGKLVFMRAAGVIVGYYPELNQWRCDGKLYRGDANDLLAWIDEKENTK
jgi:hypothetical protein